MPGGLSLGSFLSEQDRLKIRLVFARETSLSSVQETQNFLMHPFLDGPTLVEAIRSGVREVKWLNMRVRDEFKMERFRNRLAHAAGISTKTKWQETIDYAVSTGVLAPLGQSTNLEHAAMLLIHLGVSAAQAYVGKVAGRIFSEHGLYELFPKVTWHSDGNKYVDSCARCFKYTEGPFECVFVLLDNTGLGKFLGGPTADNSDQVAIRILPNTERALSWEPTTA